MDVTFIRGNILQFATQFFAPDGNQITPDSAALLIRTATLGADSIAVEIAMTETTPGVWTATWDTTGISAGTIFWAVQAVNPAAADEGFFELKTNMANV